MDKYLEDILNSQTYLSPLRYISGRIVEYDMRSANISVLLQKGIIDIDLYNKLSRLNKQSREVEIGLMIKSDPTIYTELSKGIKEYKHKFCEANNIDSLQIVRVANDAMYINTSIDLPYTFFDQYIEFRIKSISNVMININKTLSFISFINDQVSVDIKGISADKYNLHANYMISIIATVSFYIERGNIEDALNYISNIIEDYINLKLDINYYREFNSDSLYVINVRGERMGVTSLSDEYKSILNIDYNLVVLRELWSIVLEIYNKGVR
ncbi:MAG: hypothetical protein IKR19_07780 [Acholeplasmatales bacterium]|nr:hypothetical protein [Acholeplasmatales bacterium]